MTSFDLILRQARLLDRSGLVDVGISRNRVTSVAESTDAPAEAVVDLDGRVLLPGFVDSHMHLDKAFLNELPQFVGLTGNSFFAALKELKQRRTVAELTHAMRRALETMACQGTTTVRAQIDVDDVVGVRGIEAALALKAEYADRIGMQIVAFPQEGLVTNQIAADFMREALRLGADVVGGGASFDACLADAHVASIFALATAFNVDVDFHADLQTSSHAPPATWELARIAQATRRLGWEDRVTVAHLTQLGRMTPEQALPVADLLAEAGINVTVVPSAELNTSTTWSTTPARSVDEAMTQHELLLRRGVNLSYATGHIADAFSPYGRGDMLLDGLVLACCRNLGGPRISDRHILTLATTNPARALRLDPPYGFEPGSAADLVCLEARDPDLALRHVPERWLVVRQGRVAAASPTAAPA